MIDATQCSIFCVYAPFCGLLLRPCQGRIFAMNYHELKSKKNIIAVKMLKFVNFFFEFDKIFTPRFCEKSSKKSIRSDTDTQLRLLGPRQ